MCRRCNQITKRIVPHEIVHDRPCHHAWQLLDAEDEFHERNLHISLQDFLANLQGTWPRSVDYEHHLRTMYIVNHHEMYIEDP